MTRRSIILNGKNVHHLRIRATDFKIKLQKIDIMPFLRPLIAASLLMGGFKIFTPISAETVENDVKVDLSASTLQRLRELRSGTIGDGDVAIQHN